MQFGWNLIGFMESLSIVLPQDNGTVEPGNHIPSKLLHSLLLQGGEKLEGRGPAWWVENFASWWELGSPRRVLQTINHSNGFKRLVAKFYCYYDASLKPRWDTWWVENLHWRYLLVRSPLMAPHLPRGGIPISLLLPPVWSVALWSPTPPTPRSVIRWSLTTSNQQQQPMPPLSLAWKLVTVNCYKCDPVAWCVSLYRESVVIYALSSDVSS